MRETAESSPNKVKVVCTFDCAYEVHVRKEFQAAGHWVPGPVTGDEVHCLTFSAKDGTQILRVLGNNLDDAMDKMQRSIEETVVVNDMVTRQRKIDYDGYMKLNHDVGNLSVYIRRHYLWEIQHGLHASFDTPVAAAIHYLHRERGRLWVRFLSLFRRPHPEVDFDPERPEKE